MVSPSDFMSIPFDDWINTLVRDWLVPNFRPFFRSLQWPVTQVLNGLSAGLNALPMLIFTALLSLVAWRVAGRGAAMFPVAALVFIDLVSLWAGAMTQLRVVVTAVVCR